MVIEPLRRQSVLRYIAPLREGGSLPALAEADDGFRYVVKFRGGGHGSKALIADFLGALIARRLSLPVPEPILIDVDERFGITEPDQEIQDLLKSSRGLNFALHFLNGALTFDPYANPVDSSLASRIVWFDAFITNVDRTVKNTNMLLWHGNETWLIDHGAAFFFHHSWTGWETAALSPFPYIKDHVLLRKAADLRTADVEARKVITPQFIAEAAAMIPDEWLDWEGVNDSPDELRAVYRQYLTRRIEHSEIFINYAVDARRDL